VQFVVIRSIIPDRIRFDLAWHGPQVMTASCRSDRSPLHCHHEYKALM
jgi:hypothetical protein